MRRHETIRCPKCKSADVSRIPQVKSGNGNRMYKCTCGNIFEFSKKATNQNPSIEERNRDRPAKQKCGICKKPVIHSERDYLICLDCLIEISLLPKSEYRKKIQMVKK